VFIYCFDKIGQRWHLNCVELVRNGHLAAFAFG
jgi:hypothetical protein